VHLYLIDRSLKEERAGKKDLPRDQIRPIQNDRCKSGVKKKKSVWGAVGGKRPFDSLHPCPKAKGRKKGFASTWELAIVGEIARGEPTALEKDLLSPEKTGWGYMIAGQENLKTFLLGLLLLTSREGVKKRTTYHWKAPSLH